MAHHKRPRPQPQFPLKRKRFATEYLVDFNGTQAAIRAGYAPSGASAEAGRLLADVRVKALIDQAQAAQAARTDIKQEECVAQLRRLAFANLEDFTRVDGTKRVLDMSGCTRDQMAAVQELTEDVTGGTGDGERKQVLRTKLKLKDQVKAIELLCRIGGFLNDRMQHEGNVTITQLTDEQLQDRLKKLRGE
jgi:phage terminase small subunit